MEIYSTEEQQVEAIKRFWKQNGVSIIAGVVIGLAGLSGFRFYQEKQVATIQGQSSQYASLIEKVAKDGADKTAWLIEAQTFIEANPSSSYAVLTALIAAKEAVMVKDYAAAEKQLSWVIANTKTAEIIAVATLRLARVQNEQGNSEAALATLAAKLPASFTAQQQELTGDVLLKSGDEAKAKAAYQAALTASADGKNPLLQVKLNELAHVAG
ncbi:MAG: tetratricopeptide repeat protein [Gammaproteobacteria bacterium]|jgi:predicted negative regulator of RcsB-dependent stress response|nr:tetratricopeptide repeat protein [Gammaproteobacteria bacterium]MBU2180726.1 tetratricopeptide repeat protein [Gammaproteobacteria bacterium]MBU2223620.1 tetratricopeptide repeat protein [Gammaproteobacteria bacterium]MBU2279924.1 tetratricopeptide repeat protein [Gammaproteobacteria bacterium]MBU2426254.1 tetratricopeptide repeat protein [Gammaproteobacteria bacterium]